MQAEGFAIAEKMNVTDSYGTIPDVILYQIFHTCGDIVADDEFAIVFIRNMDTLHYANY